MKFNTVLETIEEPTLNAYLAQIKDLQDQLTNADPQQRIIINKRIAGLRQQLNQMKQKQQQELQKKQQELAKANTVV